MCAGGSQVCKLVAGIVAIIEHKIEKRASLEETVALTGSFYALVFAVELLSLRK